MKKYPVWVHLDRKVGFFEYNYKGSATSSKEKSSLHIQLCFTLLYTCKFNHIHFQSFYATNAMAEVRKRLGAQIVDHAAEQDPERLFAVIPKGPEISDGFQNLTMRGLAQAVNSVSLWIERTIGLSSSHETLAYMGANDIRYCIFILACQKTGYKV